jgi:hypothetical protein
MKVQLLPEAEGELQRIRNLDKELGETLDACLEIIGVDPTEFPAPLLGGGLSKQVISELRRRNVRVYRFRFDDLIAGLRVLYFVGGNKVYVTGIHDRDALADYGLVRDPILRAYGYALKYRRGEL